MMPTAHEIAASLKAPFPAKDIDWRVQRAMRTRNGDKAIVLAYITSRAVQDRLDAVVGMDGWRDHYERWGDKGVKCSLSLKIGGEWITKQDGADDTNIEPTKGGISDALKRAAVKFGIGRYLYDLDESWVEIKERGDNYINTKVKVNGKEEWIKGYWDPPQLPVWALPDGEKGQSGTKRGREPEPQPKPTPAPTQAPSSHGSAPSGVGKNNGHTQSTSDDNDAITKALTLYHSALTPIVPADQDRKDLLRYAWCKLLEAQGKEVVVPSSTTHIPAQFIRKNTIEFRKMDRDGLMNMLNDWRSQFAPQLEGAPF